MFQINHVQKPHCFDTYGHVLVQFNTIKLSGPFVNFTQISGPDLISICNTSFDCLDKLSEVSGFIEKKMFDSNLPAQVLTQLEKMENLHSQLIEQIYCFCQIVQDITTLTKELGNNCYSQEVLNYINFNIIHKYKQPIYKITDVIKKINSHVETLKPKLV